MTMSIPALGALALFLAPVLPPQAGVSTAGHARTQALAARGRVPRPAEIVVRDLINHHRHRVPLPTAGRGLALDLRWGRGTTAPGRPDVLQVGLATPHALDPTHLPPVALALVIDCSGSMGEAGKMNRVKEALWVFLEALRPGDQVALITYADRARVLHPLAPVGTAGELRHTIASLNAGGATNLCAGLQLGLQQLDGVEDGPRSRRVVLLTDGIANRGITAPDEIVRRTQPFLRRGIDLTTVGLGRNIQGELLATLARGGRGAYHFVADGSDIAKVFADEAASLIAPAARHLRLTLTFDEHLVPLRVFGYPCRPGSREIILELEDMACTSTAVVLVECAALEAPRGKKRLTVTARLTYCDAVAGGPRTLEAMASTRIGAIRPFGDHQVFRNHTMALLAQALHDAAGAHHRGLAAGHILKKALQRARHRFPTMQDRPLAVVFAMAQDLLQAVSRHPAPPPWHGDQ